jgi:protein-ribulosamine 3-kinase
MHHALRAALGVSGEQPVRGGCIHHCYRAVQAGRTVFVKLNDAQYADSFGAEAEGLRALRGASARAPEPIGHGVAGGQAYLLMEWLELGSQGDFAALGAMLAAMHRTQRDRYGWPRDNYIGSTAQENGACATWAAFWRQRRLEPQLALARHNGYQLEVVPVWRLLEGHEPMASLLHGDLWSGNAGFLAGGAPVLFDPAVYYGDREADLAMTELFGGFPEQFYEAYSAACPLAEGYRVRKHIYNLYHLLNHLNIFGGGYLEQVRATLRFLAHAL